MFGVVLWYDAEDRKMVILSESQDDPLFIYVGSSALCSADCFDAGDLVRFNVDIVNNRRQACNISVLNSRAHCGPYSPAQTGRGAVHVVRSARVVPFSLPSQRGAETPQRTSVGCCTYEET